MAKARSSTVVFVSRDPSRPNTMSDDAALVSSVRSRSPLDASQTTGQIRGRLDHVLQQRSHPDPGLAPHSVDENGNRGSACA
jgi:hypothetical protein